MSDGRLDKYDSTKKNFFVMSNLDHMIHKLRQYGTPSNDGVSRAETGE